MGSAALSGKAQNVERKEARLMTVRDSALYLAVPAATLYSRVWKKEIPFVRLGRSIRFDCRDLDRLIEESKVEPPEAPRS